MADLSKLSDEDLKAVASGDMSKVSYEGLTFIASDGSPNLPLDQQPKAPAGTKPHFLEEGLHAETPLNMIGTGFEAGGYGLRKVAEGAAKAGWAGAPVGVPALMGAEYLDPETTPGKAIQLASPFAPAVLNKIGSATKLPAAGKDAEALAQLLRARMGVPEMSTQKFLKRLEDGVDVFKKFAGVKDPIAQATEAYKDTIPGLKGVAESLSERLKTVNPQMGDYTKFVDTVDNTIKAGGSVSPQDALDGIQAIGKISRHKDFTRDKDSYALLAKTKERLIEYLGKVLPEFPQAHQDLADAHLAEDFNSWFTKNKNGSVNQLRGYLNTALGPTASLGLLAAGHPQAALGAAGAGLAQFAASSPKAAKALLRTRNFLGQDVAFGKGAAMAEAQAPKLLERTIKLGPEPKPEPLALPAPDRPTKFLGLDQEGFTTRTRLKNEIEGTQASIEKAKNSLSILQKKVDVEFKGFFKAAEGSDIGIPPTKGISKLKRQTQDTKKNLENLNTRVEALKAQLLRAKGQ